MINNVKKVIYAQKLTYQLLMILLIGFFIYIGHGVLVPIYFSILLSILLSPVTNLLEKCYLPSTLANFIAVIFALAFIAGIIYFLFSQMAGFLNDVSSIKEHLAEHFATLQNWVQQKLHMSTAQQKAIIDNATAGVKQSGGHTLVKLFLPYQKPLCLLYW